MKIWAIANQKGGVGKTTTTMNLGGLLRERGHRVLLVDLDPHGSLTSYCGYRQDKIQVSAYQLFQDKGPSIATGILPSKLSGLHLLGASPALATLDRQFASQSGKGLVLKTSLEKLSDRYDYALLDCPPVLGVLLVNALAACDKLVIPVQTEYLALNGLERMVSTVNMVSQSLKREIFYRILPTLFDRRTRSGIDCLKTLRESYPYAMAQNEIPVDTLLREAGQLNLPLVAVKPDSRGAQAYRAFVNEFEPVTAQPESDLTVAA